MKNNLKVKFIHEYRDEIETTINEWINSEGLEVGDILKSEMTATKDIDGYIFLNVLIWYISRPIKREFEVNSE